VILESEDGGVRSCGSLSHLLDRKFRRARRSFAAQSVSQLLVTNKEGGSPSEGGHIPRRDEEAALPVDDQLRQAANAEGDGWDAERHGINDSRSKSFGRRRMPEHIETGHGAMNLVDKSGADGSDAADGRHARGRSTEQHQPDAIP